MSDRPSIKSFRKATNLGDMARLEESGFNLLTLTTREVVAGQISRVAINSRMGNLAPLGMTYIAALTTLFDRFHVSMDFMHFT
jgi:hypothetical protein